MNAENNDTIYDLSKQILLYMIFFISNVLKSLNRLLFSFRFDLLANNSPINRTTTLNIIKPTLLNLL